MENFTVYTDLACETDVIQNKHGGGSEYSEEEKCGYKVARLEVLNSLGEELSGKKKGRYITVFCDMISSIDGENFDSLVSVIANEISFVTRKVLGKDASCVLVAGLGNREITADSVGPKTVDALTVTRHIKIHSQKIFESFFNVPLCAIAPGVLGQTGIETFEIIKGVCKSVKPDLVIAIDALAARSTERLGTTVQISDSGIFPGSGIGNRRSEISLATLGIPVIAVGVPTVVNSSTLVYDALQKAGYKTVDKSIEEVLNRGKSFFVSPRQSDEISERASMLLSQAIDRVFSFQEEHLNAE